LTLQLPITLAQFRGKRKKLLAVTLDDSLTDKLIAHGATNAHPYPGGTSYVRQAQTLQETLRLLCT
jgi:hypothetical protein